MHISPEIAQTVAIAAGGEKGVGVLRLHAGLLRLGAGIDLDEEQGLRPCLAISLASASARLARSTEWMASNSATASRALFDCSEPTRCNSRPPMARDQRRPFGLGLLHPVFAEHALSGGDDRLDRLGAEGFRHRDQRHRRRIAPGVAAGARDFGAHGRKSALPIHAFHFVNAVRTIQILTAARSRFLRMSITLWNPGRGNSHGGRSSKVFQDVAYSIVQDIAQGIAQGIVTKRRPRNRGATSPSSASAPA